MKIKALYDRIVADIDACDIKWTLFVSAAQSYRFDSRLSPYPPKFAPVPSGGVVANDKFDIDRIVRLIVKVPSMDILRQQLKLNAENIPVDIVDLLHWVLCRPDDSPDFSSVPKSQFKMVLQKINSVVPAIQPTHIFQVIPAAGSMAETKFQQHITDNNGGGQSRATRFAYHGSKLDSFHSILHHGLQQHLCKVNK